MPPSLTLEPTDFSKYCESVPTTTGIKPEGLNTKFGLVSNEEASRLLKPLETRKNWGNRKRERLKPPRNFGQNFGSSHCKQTRDKTMRDSMRCWRLSVVDQTLANLSTSLSSACDLIQRGQPHGCRWFSIRLCTRSVRETTTQVRGRTEEDWRGAPLYSSTDWSW